MKTAASEKASESRRESGSEGSLGPSSLPRPSSFFPRSPAARRTDRLTEGLPSSLHRPSSFFPRSPAARSTDPLTEGLVQANSDQVCEHIGEQNRAESSLDLLYLVQERSYLVTVILMSDSRADRSRLQKQRATVMILSELPDPTPHPCAPQGCH